MSDSDSDEMSEGVANGNYKSPSKRKRHKGEPGSPAKTYQFEISLLNKNDDEYTEVSYLDLVAKEEQRLRKLAQAQTPSNPFSQGGLDPYASDDDDQLKAMAASFEAKYGEKPKTKKIGKLGGKKRKIHDYDDLGIGYDETDPFIDNSECFDEVVPQEITTAHGGFYINTGALEFKENKNAIFNLSSDEETIDEKSKKTKKVKKQAGKKQVKFKDKEDKKKPKVKNTEVKRKARIINTDPKIKGPKGPKAVQKKAEAKVKTTNTNNKVNQSNNCQEVAKQKPPELVDLEAQLDAFSKSVELSKSESSFSKPATPVSKATAAVAASKVPVKQSPLHDLKLPSSVKISKVESSSKPSKKVENSTTKSKAAPKTGSKVSAPAPGSAWQNLVNFSEAVSASSAASTKPTNSIYQNSKLSKDITKNVSSSVTIQSSPKPAKSSAASSPMFSSEARDKVTPPKVSMFQHDPKNILSSVMTTMSSVLGTTAPYFAQKLQEKSASDMSSSTRALSTSSAQSKPSITSTSVAPSRKEAVPIDLASVVTSLGIASPLNLQFDRAKETSKSSSSTQPSMLPSTPTTSVYDSNPGSRGGVLSPEMTRSLLGIAEHMMNDMQKPVSTSPGQQNSLEKQKQQQLEQQRQQQQQMLLEQQRQREQQQQQLLKKQEQQRILEEQKKQKQILEQKRKQQKLLEEQKKQELEKEKQRQLLEQQQQLLEQQKRQQLLDQQKKQQQLIEQQKQQQLLEQQKQQQILEQQKQQQLLEQQKQQQIVEQQKKQQLLEQQKKQQLLEQQKRQQQLEQQKKQQLLEQQREQQLLEQQKKQQLLEQQKQQQRLQEQQKQIELQKQHQKLLEQQKQQKLLEQQKQQQKMLEQQKQQQQQSAFMSQFQNFTNQQLQQQQNQQPKKSSAYEISSLLNSQPLPLHGSPSSNNSRSSSQSPNVRSPVITQQQMVNLQQMPGSVNPQNYQLSHGQQVTSALPSISSITGSLSDQQFQQQMNHQQIVNVQQQPQQQQQGLSRQQQQQQQQQQQSLLQQFGQNYFF